MHRRKRDGRGNVGADIVYRPKQLFFFAFPGSAFEQSFPEQGFELVSIGDKTLVLAGIDHRIDECLHAGSLDSFQVLSDGHVEDEGRFNELAIVERRIEHVKDIPRFDIFIRRLRQGELGRPFNVVPFITGVDTGLVHLEGVQDLDGLQFDENGADQIACNDVLRQLCVGCSDSRAVLHVWPKMLSSFSPYHDRRDLH